jgi:hypothetical protein
MKQKSKNLKEKDADVANKGGGQKDPSKLASEADPAAPSDGADATGDHADAAQDMALIKKMIAEYLSDDDMNSEEIQKMSKEAYEAYVEMGYEADEAMKCAGHSMKLAKHMASKQSEGAEVDDAPPKPEGDEQQPPPKPGGDKKAAAKKDDAADAKDKSSATDDEQEAKEDESKEDEAMEAKEDENKEDESKEKKESAAVIKLKGEMTAMREKLAKYEAEKHLEKLLETSGLPSRVQKACRESVGETRTLKFVEEKVKIFVEAYKVSADIRENDGLQYVVSAEKKPSKDAKKDTNFADCLS